MMSRHMIGIVIVHLILLTLCFSHRSLWGNTPEYESKWSELMNISASQTFITDYWRLPAGIKFNPAMGIWPLNTTGNKLINSDDYGIFVMSAQGYGCSGCATGSYVFQLNGTSMKYPFIYDKRDVFARKTTGEFYPILLGDPRIFRQDGKTFILSVGEKYNVLQPYLTELKFDEQSKNLYVQEPFLYLSTDHEYGHVPQKNWSPFEYKFRRKQMSSSSSKTFFVFSVDPHKIVDANETSVMDDKVLTTHTICETVIIEPIDSIWKWGPIHGGSNSLLVDTPFGPRYLAFFHSQSHHMTFWMTTYFMGAYLFDVDPPFSVTHISDHPIIPSALYGEEIDGWAFKAIDYIIFPMNIIEYDDKILLSLGRNDRSGYVVVLNTKGLVSSMKPVHSRVVKDRFYEHAYFSNY